MPEVRHDYTRVISHLQCCNSACPLTVEGMLDLEERGLYVSAPAGLYEESEINSSVSIGVVEGGAF